ncbi:hypothetical protein C5167_036847 [Papaver somniferum]|uniref:RING-CH-type domain-containing protein n=1 Tax=Papaver somniferum TaxID=3469 RepID=A0A4Y7I7U7_PAPSO|nr:E3 ubiquitin-protein ligase MARCH8-like [Papaver somniferum]RZC43890.1 hypothetical protein C5167_036847 [Papaver somniferum]
MGEQESVSLLNPPTPVSTQPTTEIDLEAGQNQCRICLETDERGFIAPCMCKGTAKYVHRECLDQWRSIKEGFAFAHCTTCKAQYHMSVQSTVVDRKWRTLKFRFFVTRDIFFIFICFQLAIALLAYLVYLVDASQNFALRLALEFPGVVSFYYICGALLLFVLVGLSGCFLTCFDSRVRSDLAQPCRQLTDCCCSCGCRDPRCPAACLVSCYQGLTSAGDCACLPVAGEGAPLFIIGAVIALVLFAFFGLIYSILVATIAGQRIWQRHYHILAKRMLTKEYVVEDVDGSVTDSNWSPPPLPPEHVEQLKALGLL